LPSNCQEVPVEELQDVDGTAQGGLPVQLALAHQHLTGIGFDLATVRPFSEEYVRSFELSDRLRFQAGYYLTDALPEADVLIVGHILHGEDLEDKCALIQKAHQALPKRGRTWFSKN
jgi:O-methyltransferase domain